MLRLASQAQRSLRKEVISQHPSLGQKVFGLRNESDSANRDRSVPQA
jgi:2-oxo-4-hydroxy-4-carboxy--5-ureidoimidazoline (OHCU) decarboxylase